MILEVIKATIIGEKHLGDNLKRMCLEYLETTKEKKEIKETQEIQEIILDCQRTEGYNLGQIEDRINKLIKAVNELRRGA